MREKFSLTIEEAASYTGIGRNTLRQLVEWKKIPILKVGRKTLLRKDHLETLIQMNQGKNLRDRECVCPVRETSGCTAGYAVRLGGDA